MSFRHVGVQGTHKDDDASAEEGDLGVDVGGRLRSRMQGFETSLAKLELDWGPHLFSDSGEDDNAHTETARGSRDPAPASRSAAPPPPSPHAAVPSAAAVSSSQGRRPNPPRDPGADPWANIVCAHWGKFVYDRKRNSVGAHCPFHPDCRANKVQLAKQAHLKVSGY